MNIFQNSDAFQKLVQSCFQVVGYVFMAGLAVILILVWALTEPLFQLVEKAVHRDNLKDEVVKKKIVNTGAGIALLVVGISMIIHSFNAPDSTNTDTSSSFVGAPTEKTSVCC